MTPHDSLMASAIAFKKELLEYLEEFEPRNRAVIEGQLDRLVYECSVMPNEGHEPARRRHVSKETE